MALDPHMPHLQERALEGDLTPEETVALERHLAECPLCAREFMLAGRIRTLLGSVPPAKLAPVEADRLAEKTELALGWRRAPLRLKPALTVSLAAAGLFLLVVIGLNFDRESWLAERPKGYTVSALAGAGPGAGAALEREELPGFAPTPLGNFSSPMGIAGLALSGFGQPSFVRDRAFGRRVLRLGRAETESVPRELMISLGAENRPPAHASIWIFPEEDSVRVSLSARTVLGRVLKAGEVYRAKAGEWSWLLFDLPPEELRAGGGLRDLRFGVLGSSAVMLTQPEIWCKGGGK